MLLGMNEDIPYKGEVYHVQTEDSGVKNPRITTLIFKGGTILGSKRTTYEDIVKMDKLEKVVREIMSEQHLAVIAELKKGAYTKKPGASKTSPAVASPAAAPKAKPAAAPKAKPAAAPKAKPAAAPKTKPAP